MKLADAVSVMRSKNAGPFLTTLDLLFKDREAYEKVKNANLFTRERTAKIFKVSPEQVMGIHFVDPILAVKITLRKPEGRASGDPGCADMFGAQQHTPLYDLVIPENIGR